MELIELFYVALGTIGIMVVLHLGTFGISRMMKPAAPKIVYVQAPPAPPAPPAPQVQQAPQQPLSQPPPSIQLPTYDVAPQRTPEQASPTVPSLPPPIETRSTTKQGGTDMGMPR